MDLSTAVLATIPPVFAILVEIFNPVSEKLIRNSAERDLRQYEVGSNHPHLIDDATKLTNGAVEVSGLAPTFVATVSSGFGVLYDFPKPTLMAIYGLIFVVLALILIRLLGGQTFLQIDCTKQPQQLWGRVITLPWTGSGLIARFIFIANGLLIVFVIVAYCASLAKL